MTTKPAGTFTLQLEQVNGYEFRVLFDKEGHAPLHVDEPAPLSGDSAPNPTRLLAAAVASCLCGSLVFCLAKAKVPPKHVRASVRTELVRNERRRLRVGKLDVTLTPALAEDSAALSQCLDVFEDFCVVTESVRHGIEVNVTVDRHGEPPTRQPAA